MTRQSDTHLSHPMIDSIKSAFAGLIDGFASGIFSSISRETGIIFDNFESRALMLQRKLLRNFAAAAIMGAAGILLLSSIYFYLVEYGIMGRASAFLLLAVLLFILGWLIKKYNGGGNYAQIKK